MTFLKDFYRGGVQLQLLSSWRTWQEKVEKKELVALMSNSRGIIIAGVRQDPTATDGVMSSEGEDYQSCGWISHHYKGRYCFIQLKWDSKHFGTIACIWSFPQGDEETLTKRVYNLWWFIWWITINIGELNQYNIITLQMPWTLTKEYGGLNPLTIRQFVKIAKVYFERYQHKVHLDNFNKLIYQTDASQLTNKKNTFKRWWYRIFNVIYSS